MGHVCTAACQGLLSLLQKLPLFWSINILLGSLLSYTHKWKHIAIQCTNSYPCTDTEMQSFLWCLAIRIQRICFSSHCPYRHHRRRVLVLVLFQFWIPLRTTDDIGWCVRAERAQRYTFIFTCNHFSSTTHPSLMPSSPLPYSPPSPSQYELIKSYYLTQLPSGLAPLLSLTLTHRHPYTDCCLLFFSAPSVILTQTHTDTVIRSTNLLYFWIRLLKWDMDTVSAFSSVSISLYQPICRYVSPK